MIVTGLNNLVPIAEESSPTVVISSPSGAVSAPFTATITFEEGVTGFTVTDITPTNATLSAFNAVSSTVYTVLVTPTSSPVTLFVAASVCTAISTGGPNAASNSLIVSYDSTVPVPVISGSTEVTDPYTLTFTFNVPVTGFTIGDITFSNSTLSTFNAISSTVYTVLVSPIATGNVDISVGAGVCVSNFDAANGASSTFTSFFTLDYLSNIIDEWTANRGYVLNTNNTTVSKWKGRLNGIVMTASTGSGGISIPSGGIQAIDGANDVFTIPSSQPPINGAFTFVVNIQIGSDAASRCTALDLSTSSPSCIIYWRISSSNHNMGIKYGSTTFDTGVPFPYGGSYHQVAVVVDGVHASFWVDKVQQGSTFNLSGGAINTTGHSFTFGAITGSGFPPQGNVKRLRLYSEALTSNNIAKLTDGDFATDFTDDTPVRLVFIGGQSNVGPTTDNNIIANYDPSLQNGFADVYLWDYIGDPRFVTIAAHTDSGYIEATSNPIRCGPFLKVAYDLRVKYPDDELRIIETYQGNTSLAVDWAPAGTLYTSWIGRAVNAMTLLTVEQRNIVQSSFLWIQGEKDANDATQASNYFTNLSTLMSNVRSVLGSDLIVTVSYLSNRATETYQSTVRTAEENWVALDPTKNFGIDTDSAINFPFTDAGTPYANLHYETGGLTKIGEVHTTHL